MVGSFLLCQRMPSESRLVVDLIFKNQAMNQKEKSGQFVNDLLRTEFHKYASVLFTAFLV